MGGECGLSVVGVVARWGLGGGKVMGRCATGLGYNTELQSARERQYEYQQGGLATRF